MAIKIRKTKTGRDKFARASIYHKIRTWLETSDKYKEYAEYAGGAFDFAHLVVTVEECDDQYTFPRIDADAPTLAKAFVKWCGLDAEIVDAHQQAIIDTETPPAVAEPDAEKN
jgi:hypothetical protein